MSSQKDIDCPGCPWLTRHEAFQLIRMSDKHLDKGRHLAARALAALATRGYPKKQKCQSLLHDVDPG